jgi:hypothetical protein
MVLTAGMKGIQRSTIIGKLTEVAGGAREDIIATLIQSNFMIERKTPAKSGKGRPAVSYLAKEYYDEESES